MLQANKSKHRGSKKPKDPAEEEKEAKLAEDKKTHQEAKKATLVVKATY